MYSARSGAQGEAFLSLSPPNRIAALASLSTMPFSQHKSMPVDRKFGGDGVTKRPNKHINYLSDLSSHSLNEKEAFANCRKRQKRLFSSGGKPSDQNEAPEASPGRKVSVHYSSNDPEKNLEDFNERSGTPLSQANLKRIQYVLSVDDDKGLYKRIRETQIIKLEQSRQKTAANVNRALMGNVVICLAKFGAWASSGSSSMLSEFIHSVVDCGNQSLLLVGLRSSQLSADRKHPYGYGKSVYFWALVSALGTFFLGAGISLTHSVGELMHPSLQEITWQVWSVLIFSFTVDGYVLRETLKDIYESKPESVSIWQHISNLRDPSVLAVLLEDGAACLGILLAIGGISLSHVTGNPIYDGIAGVAISALLGGMGLALVRMNHRFLLGQAVDKDILEDIEKILLTRRSIDNIGSVQSQWISSDTFSYKAEVDFDGTYLAAKLMPIVSCGFPFVKRSLFYAFSLTHFVFLIQYQHEFTKIQDSLSSHGDLQVLLAFFAEDVIRTVEREVRHVEAVIRKKYPGAEYIELEPMSIDADRLAIYDNIEDELRRVESDALNRYLKSLKKEGDMEGMSISSDHDKGADNEQPK